MADTLRQSTTLDSDDDEDEVSSTSQNFDEKTSTNQNVDEKTSTNQNVDEKTSKNHNFDERKPTKDSEEDAFDSSEETERRQTWKMFDRLTSNFFRVIFFCLNHILIFFLFNLVEFAFQLFL